MNTQMNKWMKQTLVFNGDLHEALQQQYHAAQFLALVGHHLLPRLTDDSNTNMQYLADQEMLVGNPLANGIRLALHLVEMDLFVLSKDHENIGKIALPGKSRQQVLDDLKKNLAENEIDISKLDDKMHYDIPDHFIIDGAVFAINDKKYFQENAYYRYNAEIVLSHIAASYKGAAPVRIWPHHFDTGTFIPLSYNDSGGVSGSMGLGWAIPDSMVDEPYYYLSFWTEDTDKNIADLPALDSGKWMMPGWNGAVLRHSEILQNDSARSQYEKTESFFKSGMEAIAGHIK